MVIFDLEHLKRVHIDDDLETGDRVRVRIALGRLTHPQVAPAQPPITPLLGHHGLAVSPDVEEHQGRVGYASRRQSGQHLGMLMQRMINVVVLINGEVRTDTRLVGPGVNAITDKINHCFVCLVGLLIPKDRQ